jgi:hypothetical protein
MERSVSSLAAHMPAVSNRNGLFKWGLALLLVCASAFAIKAVQTKRADRLDAIRQSVIAAGRPRAIFILKDWNAPGQPYVTTINNEAEKFGTSIDFSKLSSEDPMNKKLIDSLGVQYFPITAIFDRDGNDSKTTSGPIPQADLDRYLTNVLQQGASVKKPAS